MRLREISCKKSLNKGDAFFFLNVYNSGLEIKEIYIYIYIYALVTCDHALSFQA